MTQTETTSYHLDELRIAKSARDRHRILPPILSADHKVLDVGCGAGQTLLATNFEPSTIVVGLDIDKSALSLGRQLDKNINFVCATADCLPFQAASLDFVFSRVALPYMNVHKTLFEIYRVLKTGGRVWLVLHPYSMILRESVDALSRLKLKRAVVCVYVIVNGVVLNSFGKEFHLPLRRHYYESFQTIRGITKLLREAGFDEIRAERNGFFVATATKVH